MHAKRVLIKTIHIASPILTKVQPPHQEAPITTKQNGHKTMETKNVVWATLSKRLNRNPNSAILKSYRNTHTKARSFGQNLKNVLKK